MIKDAWNISVIIKNNDEIIEEGFDTAFGIDLESIIAQLDDVIDIPEGANRIELIINPITFKEI